MIPDRQYLYSEDDYSQAANHFTPEEISEDIKQLTGSYAYDTVAEWFTGDESYPGAVMAAWAKFATLLNLPVTQSGTTVSIRREKSFEAKWKISVQRLWTNKYDELKNAGGE